MAITTTLFVFGAVLAWAGTSGVSVAKPPANLCLGSKIKVGAKYRGRPGARNTFRVTIMDPTNKKVFAKKAKATKRGRYWQFAPSKAGTHRILYRTPRGKRNFRTKAIECANPAPLPPASPVPASPSSSPPPSSPPPSSPPPSPPPGDGITLSDNDSGVSMFTMANLVPGSIDSACIKVSYTGTPTSHVRLYGETTGELPPYLDLRITRGIYAPTDPLFDSCANFSPDATNYIGAGAGVIYNGTLQDYADDYVAGLPDPTAGSPEDWTHPEDHVYKFEITLQDNNSAQGLNATQVFTWEARDIP